ncbi:hypothetical protein GCM10018789_59590 [Streptomyces werraensis]|nr:hypothetical protein GCM10018789_59590 [Streptomyces werraensis]
MIDRADATLRHLARYWETFRQKDDPKRSQAIAAIEAVLYEGRAAGIHVIYDGPATVGGHLIPGAREQFSTVSGSPGEVDLRLCADSITTRQVCCPPTRSAALIVGNRGGAGGIDE